VRVRVDLQSAFPPPGPRARVGSFLGEAEISLSFSYFLRVVWTHGHANTSPGSRRCSAGVVNTAKIKGTHNAMRVSAFKLCFGFELGDFFLEMPF
jgi:hypothetical protein